MMAIVSIPDQKRTICDAKEISAFLEPFGIWYECWDVAGRLNDGATHDDILKVYKPEIDRLKKRGGLVTADIIDVDSNTEGLDAMLDKFKCASGRPYQCTERNKTLVQSLQRKSDKNNPPFSRPRRLDTTLSG